MSELIVTDDDFPHGVQCADCGCPLLPGMGYSERLESVGDGGVVVVTVVCTLCAWGLW